MKNFSIYLSRKLEVNVEPWSLSYVLEDSKEEIQLFGEYEDRFMCLKFATALGLALREQRG